MSKTDLNQDYTGEAYLYWCVFLNSPYFNSSGQYVAISYDQNGFSWTSPSNGTLYNFTSRSNLLEQLQSVISNYVVTATEFNSKMDISALVTNIGNKITNTNHNVALYAVNDALYADLAGLIPIANGGMNNATFTDAQFLKYNSATGKVESSGYSSSSFLTSASALNPANLSSAVPISKGGTNTESLTNSKVLYFDGTKIASTAYDYTAVLTTSSGLAAANLTGVVAISKGGTNASSFTTNKVLYFNGTSIVSAAYDQSAVLTSDSNLSAAKLTGTVAIANGGTNNTTFTTDKVLYFDGSKIVSTDYDYSNVQLKTDTIAGTRLTFASNIAADTVYALYGVYSTSEASGAGYNGQIWVQI